MSSICKTGGAAPLYTFRMDDYPSPGALQGMRQITFGSSSGYVQWNQARLPLDQVQLNSALASSGFSLSSLQVVSGASKAEISGTVSGSPARIEATGHL